jgi:hypothetical protein
MKVSEVACAEHLDSSVVLTVETGDSGGTTCRLSAFGRTKPEAEMVRVDWLDRRVHRRIRERRLIVYDRSFLAAGGLRYYECLDVEAPQETPVTLSQIT